jgi:hypothetical protein
MSYDGPPAAATHGRRAAPTTAPVPQLTPVQAALIAETCSKGEVLWVRPPGEKRHHPAWHVWHNDGICLVYGIGEQMLPLLSGEVEVIARSKETGARLVTFTAYAEALAPGTAEWEGAADALAAHRLNAEDPNGARQRWAAGGLVTMLHPVQLLRSGAGEDDAPSEAAPPPRGVATTLGQLPYHLGGRLRRARRRSR